MWQAPHSRMQATAATQQHTCLRSGRTGYLSVLTVGDLLLVFVCSASVRSAQRCSLPRSSGCTRNGTLPYLGTLRYATYASCSLTILLCTRYSRKPFLAPTSAHTHARGICRLIRPNDAHPPCRLLEWSRPGRTRCRAEDHPIPSLLNLSNRGRGDVDPAQTSFGVREDENEKQTWWGSRGPDRTGPPAKRKPWDSQSRDHATLHSIAPNPLLRSRAVCRT